MRFLSRAAAALLIAGWASAAPAIAQTCICPAAGDVAAFSGPVIQSDEVPPPLPEYEQPPMPALGYIWTPGYWAWNNDDYYWVPGVWVEPPQEGLLWTPGYWAFVGGVYFFHRGYWAAHVGFYGGVNYGYGYNGVGYEGGRWDKGRFSYNATVNNFGGIRVVNVYSQPVVVPTGVGRASYNGGPGGNPLKPTPEQEQVTAEQHVRPTPAQLSQARAASVDPEQFRSANLGKPAVAATPRPGDLKGPGIVPAKAAASAQTTSAPAQSAAPKAEEKLAPGAKAPGQAQKSAPNAEQKPLPGAAQPAKGEKPRGAEPLKAPKAMETLPKAQNPAGAGKLARPETAPNTSRRLPAAAERKPPHANGRGAQVRPTRPAALPEVTGGESGPWRPSGERFPVSLPRPAESS